MAGLGKNPRAGKRSSSSSSSYISTVTTVVFVAFCILGVWMLTSSSTSSLIPGRKPTTSSLFTASRVSTTSKDDDSTTFDDTPSDEINNGNNLLGQVSDLVKELGGQENERDETEKDQESRTTTTTTAEEDQGKESESSFSDENSQTQNTEEIVEEETKERSEESQHEHQTEENVEKQQQSEAGDENLQQTNEETEEKSVRLDDRDDRQHQSQNEGDGISNQEEQGQSEQEREVKSNGENQEKPQQQIEDENREQFDKGLEGESNGDQQESQQGNEGENDHESQQRIEDSSTEIQSQSQLIDEENDTVNSHESQQKDGENHESQQKEDETDNNQEGQQSDKLTDLNASDSFPDGAQSEISNESEKQKGSWSTQADQSENEKERHQEKASHSRNGGGKGAHIYHEHTWELCNVTAGADYIPCLDNVKALKHLHSTKHFEHRERHCPEEGPSCLVPLPKGYRQSIEWPKSRDRIWYQNVPHTKLAVVKGHQNWVKVMGEYLTFPGGGTQFIHGALHYINFIQQAVPRIAWGKHTRVILDVGCGVASFGGFLFEKDVIAMSFAPKDEHEAQVQFALERGIPAISAVMGSQRLPFPGRVFDIVHCARCRVPWHAEGGTLLLELNRVLRPGGYFVWSATPVYQKLKEDVEIWKEMTSLTRSMCWDLITIKKDRLNSVGAAIYRKPVSNECFNNRKRNNPPICEENDDPSAAWYVPLQTCMHKVPVDPTERGSQWPKEWPQRLQSPPYWLNNTQTGVYGKPAPADFIADYEHWKRVVSKSYLSGLGISWANVRNVMDMRAVYGGFAAALNDLKVWVMNVVNVDSPDTLPIIYERGLFGIYHDWCESFSTYPRSYDLLHADHLFSNLKKRCNIVPVMAEIDRIVRPGGKLIVRDESSVVDEIVSLLKSLHWDVRLTFSKDQLGILSAQKSDWRPEALSGSS
ncbi:putative methyltransferase PMT25 [Tasmannia lanceolata]|uniref:putative methyltransferase PMT25 n=1 Tax=Tasmannia lanceolata TaxID=3420 RepID=UPI0040648D23